MAKHRYSEFCNDIDVDAFEAAIGFEPIHTHRGNDVGHCLFPENHTHGDTTGKFAIHRDKRVYNCFVCGGGSLLSLAMELYGFDVDEATDWLRQFAVGDSRSDETFKDHLMGMLADAEKRVATMPYFNERVLERFTDDRSYFATRGISDEVIEEYHLCCGDHVMKPAPMKRDAEGNLYKIDEDYYGPTAIFPHYWDGRLVGWQHRWLDHPGPKWLAKYTNTTDFPKDSTLFNFDVARRVNEKVIVVESVPTVLYLASYGIPAVSYFGGQPGSAQLRLLRRFSQGVILAPDNDETGDRFVKIATDYLLDFIPLFAAEKVTLKLKADLGDYAKYGFKALREHLTERVHEVKVTL